MHGRNEQTTKDQNNTNLAAKNNRRAHLVHHSTVGAIGQSLHRNVRLLVANGDLHVAPDEQTSAVLGPVHLMGHVIPIRHVVHAKGHVGPIGDRFGIMHVKTGGMSVKALGVGRLVDEPNRSEPKQLGRVGMRMGTKTLLLLEYVVDQMVKFFCWGMSG